MNRLSLGAAAAVLMLAAGAAPASAAGKCVRVIGYEWRGEAQSADPADMVTIDDAMRVDSIYEGLAYLDNDYQPQPVLAESWESNADGSEWTFHLRKGVKFHDGKDFTAKDVIYTFNRLLDEKTNSGARAILTPFLEGGTIEAKDDHTVVFKLKKPAVELPTQITTKFSRIVPEGATHESLQKRPIGTGPFMMDAFTPNQPKNGVMKNPHYWQAGLPKADCLELTAISEPVSQAAALISGDADLVIVVNPTALQTLKASPGIRLSQSPGGTVMTLSMWVDTPPFDDVKVRQAMKLVVDREKVVQTALLGAGVPGNDNPIAPTSLDAYRKDLIKRDVAKAKQLLAEAGHPNGIDIELYTAEAFPGMLQIAEAYKEMAADAGIRVNVIKTPTEGYWDNIWLKHPFLTSSWGGRPPAEGLAIAYHSKAQWPETHWFRKDFDDLLAKASGTVDPAERRKIYQEAQKLLAEEGGVIVPGFQSTVAAMRGNCAGYEANNNVNNQDYLNVTCQ